MVRAERLRLGATHVALQGRAPRPAGQLAAPVASMVERLQRTGWFAFAKRELSIGRNPAPKGWQRLLCDGLLRGGVGRDEFRIALQTELQMTPGSAKVRASRGLAVFVAGELIAETSPGLFTLRQN